MTTQLERILEAPLPSDIDCLNMPYRPTKKEINSTFDAINNSIFGGILSKPKISLSRLRNNTWGCCDGSWENRDGNMWPYTKKITLYSMYPSVHVFAATLGHEMIHHWQWTVHSVERIAQGKKPLMSHGPTFYQWRGVFEQKGLWLARIY